MRGNRRFGLARSRHTRRVLLVLVALLVAAAAVAAYGTSLFASLEGSTVDTRFSIRGHLPRPKNIVVVAISGSTFATLNQQWPFPRKLEGKVLTVIAKQHPAAIAFDIQFSEPSELGQKDDVALLTAIDNFPGKTVFSFTETNGPGGGVSFLGSSKGNKLLSEVGSRPGNGLFAVDPGGIYRKMDYSIDGLPTLAVVTAEVAQHRRITPAQFGGPRWIDFLGPNGSFPTVDFAAVANKTVPPDFFKGKIVVVGASAPSLNDLHATSTDSLMPGPEIQANAISTILRGFPLNSAAGWVNVVLIALLTLAVPLASLRLGPLAATSVGVVLGVGYAVAAQIAFDSGAIVAVVYPLGGLVLATVGSLAVQLVTEAIERLRVRDLFSRFVPEDVVDEVLKSADGLRLGGVQREGTVMFTDLRGFTSFAESLTPAQVIEVLNQYLSEMSDAILDHGGTLVAYMGDGIMAVFGAPLVQADHADRALATAREMLSLRLPRFNGWLREQGLHETGFRMGIGLNSGHVMSGHVGSERRVEYAAVGDTTNSASRIESMTKGTPHQLLLSDSTREALTTPAEDLVFFEETEIRGREARIKLWSIADSETGSEPEPLQASGPAV
jgi:adenylate cyclase